MSAPSPSLPSQHPHPHSGRSDRRHAVAGLAVVIAALMVWAKFAWLHNDAAAEACALGAQSFDCDARMVLGELMYRKVFAWAAIAVAAGAVLLPRLPLVVASIVVSTFALAFYNADPGAFAAALTVVAIARLPRA